MSIDYVGNPQGKAPTCKHGPSECQGNIQQLCMAQHATSDRQLLDFVLCQNVQKLDIGSKALAKSCAVTAARITDEDTLQSLVDCWSSYQGEGLLRKSMSRTMKKGVTYSPGIFIAG